MIQDISGELPSVSAIGFSPDGSTLLVGASDGSPQLWNYDAAKPIGTSVRNNAAAFAVKGVPSVAFSPDGNSVVVAAGDGSVQLWHSQIFTDGY